MHLLDPGPSRRGWHRLQLAMQCPRKYALYIASKATPGPVSSPALIRGVLLHLALAHHYALKKNPKADIYTPLDAMKEKVQSQPNPEEWDKHSTIVARTYLQYDLHWAAERYLVSQVERELVGHIQDTLQPEPYLYTQRADLIVQHPRSGLYYIVDHKTTGRRPSTAVKYYTLSGQFRGYNFFGRSLWGDQYGGVLLNMIQWPKKDGSATFLRTELATAPYADKTFRDTVIHAERLIRDLRDKHGHETEDPMHWPAAHHETACWTPYGPCKNHTRCEWGT